MTTRWPHTHFAFRSDILRMYQCCLFFPLWPSHPDVFLLKNKMGWGVRKAHKLFINNTFVKSYVMPQNKPCFVSKSILVTLQILFFFFFLFNSTRWKYYIHTPVSYISIAWVIGETLDSIFWMIVLYSILHLHIFSWHSRCVHSFFN